VRDGEKVATKNVRASESSPLALYAAPTLIYFWFFVKKVF
tara:strand:- start:586 stop:705 length:120 start_codon:yes stop_codon:yes gene_type:complete